MKDVSIEHIAISNVGSKLICQKKTKYLILNIKLGLGTFHWYVDDDHNSLLMRPNNRDDRYSVCKSSAESA